MLKGRKQDIAELDTGKLIEVGTIANNVSGTPRVNNGDFIGVLNSTSGIDEPLGTRLGQLNTLGIITTGLTQLYFEYSVSHKLMSAYYDDSVDMWLVDENGVPQHTSFEKYKVSISFDSIRIDEPKTLNAKEYITIMFGGSATLTDGSVVLGNQLTKVGIKKYKVQAQTDIAITDDYHWLEPLEMPSGLGISGEISQLASHNFLQNTHNDGIKASINYSFVLDFAEPLIKQWWRYARYGVIGTLANTYSDGVSPNMLYKLQEIWSSWGEVEVYTIIAKAVDNIDIENTESDALTIRITFDIQKE